AAMLRNGAVFLEAIDGLAEGAWRDLEVPSSMLGSVVAGEGVRRRTEEQLELWDVEPRWVVSSAAACGVVNGYDHPVRLGVDRWVALIGARNRVLARGPARPVLGVMSGGAAAKLSSISDLPFEMVDTLIFDGLLQLQSKSIAS